MNYSLWSVKNLFRTSIFNIHCKYASMQTQKYQVQDESESSQSEGRSKKKLLFSPELSREKLERLNNISSVVIGLNLVSWAKISVGHLEVLDWNTYSLPKDFLDVTETDIVQAAHTIKAKIPNSELYVMETVPYRWNRYPNYICLRSMLVLLLSSLGDDAKYHNIVFQKPSILNNVHSLLIGGERTSAKRVLKEKSSFLFSENIVPNGLNRKEKSDCYSLLNVQNTRLHSFQSYSIEKQEGLSIALLLALTFLDTAVFQNPETLSKLNKKHQYKTLQC